MRNKRFLELARFAIDETVDFITFILAQVFNRKSNLVQWQYPKRLSHHTVAADIGIIRRGSERVNSGGCEKRVWFFRPLVRNLFITYCCIRQNGRRNGYI